MRNIAIFKSIIFLGIISIISSCNDNEWNYSLRQEVNVDTLVKVLRKDSLFKSFNGYGVTTRDETSSVYYISREQDHGIYHRVNYSPEETKYIQFIRSFEDEKLKTFKTLNSVDSLEIINKAHELITILKRINVRWAGGEYGRFNCSFNDGIRMTYVQNKNELDSNFYRFHKNLNWVDDNFVIYE